MRLAPLLVILSLGLALPGCGDSGEAGGGDDEFFEDDLELQSGARVLEATVRDEALVSSDEEAGEYVFDAAALASAGIEIESGNVLLIAEEALIRVTSATPRAGELVVTGDPATLPDLVDNGILAWDLELGAEGTPAPLLLIGDKLIAPKGGGLSGGSIDYSTEVDGFKISVKVTPDSNAGQLQVVIQVDRGVGGAVDFRAVATGTVRLFRHVLDMGIRGGVTENWGFATRNLEFNVEVELAGANAGTASTTLVLPGPFQLRFPIPTTLPLGLNVAVTFNLLASPCQRFDAVRRKLSLSRLCRLPPDGNGGVHDRRKQWCNDRRDLRPQHCGLVGAGRFYARVLRTTNRAQCARKPSDRPPGQHLLDVGPAPRGPFVRPLHRKRGSAVAPGHRHRGILRHRPRGVQAHVLHERPLQGHRRLPRIGA